MSGGVLLLEDVLFVAQGATHTSQHFPAVAHALCSQVSLDLLSKWV